MVKKKNFLILAIIIILFGTFFSETKIIDKIMYPKKYSEQVIKYSNEFNVDKNLVYSIMKAESKFKKNAVSNKGAKGLMQISDITRNWAIEELNLGTIDIFDPEINIRIGCWYLNKLYKEFGDKNLVIAAYNGGSGNVRKWLDNKDYSRDGENLHSIPFQETSNYVQKVNKNYEMYNKIYSEKGKN
ncbi:lytic transglycosylase domain-containing protein [Romboutsia sp.]|uniref:lytic transglycosylase domain-containing protein n=1 Tax=Romboutsia sp. TaxID=1965302 RepID=UPI003F2B396C